jgi:hypothetical protein
MKPAWSKTRIVFAYVMLLAVALGAIWIVDRKVHRVQVREIQTGLR